MVFETTTLRLTRCGKQLRALFSVVHVRSSRKFLAGVWSMTQKSPTNEDASDVIVIWFRDAGITYLLSWNCWQAVAKLCLHHHFRCTSDSFSTCFRLIPIIFRPVFDQVSIRTRPFSDWNSIKFRAGFDQFRPGFDYFLTNFRSVSIRFRSILDQLSISFQPGFDQISISFDHSDELWQLWAISLRWSPVLGRCSVIVLTEAYFISMLFFALHQTIL